MDRRNPVHQITFEDQKQITELVILDYSEEEAARAYFACGKDINKAAAKLLNDRIFNKRSVKSFGDLMYTGKYIGNENFGFSKKMNVVSTKYNFETKILEKTLKKITSKDPAKVAKLIKKDTTSEAAAKDFLIQEKKRPIEEDKKDIKACFQQ